MHTLLYCLVLTGIVALGGMLCAGWPWREPRRARLGLGGPLCIGLAVMVGAWLQSGHPRWPLAVDHDRFLGVLIPAAILVECLAVFLQGWPAWVMRWMLALLAAPILLYGSAYLSGRVEESSFTWSPGETCLWLGSLALILAAVWFSLIFLDRKTCSRWLLLILGLVHWGAGITIIFSGYATGGFLGLFLGAAYLGAALGSLAWQTVPALGGTVGIAVVGLFGLVVCGKFFGELTLFHGALLLLAPTLCWLPHGVLKQKLSANFRWITALVLVLIPLAYSGRQAWVNSQKAEQPREMQGEGELSPEDYQQFGR